MPFSYTTMPRPKKSEHYVNNKDFLAALEQYSIDVERSFVKENGRPPTKEERAKR